MVLASGRRWVAVETIIPVIEGSSLGSATMVDHETIIIMAGRRCTIPKGNVIIIILEAVNGSALLLLMLLLLLSVLAVMLFVLAVVGLVVVVVVAVMVCLVLVVVAIDIGTIMTAIILPWLL